ALERNGAATSRGSGTRASRAEVRSAGTYPAPVSFMRFRRTLTEQDGPTLTLECCSACARTSQNMKERGGSGVGLACGKTILVRGSLLFSFLNLERMGEDRRFSCFAVPG